MRYKSYLQSSGLLNYLEDFKKSVSSDQDVMYHENDIVFLHQSIRQRKPFTTLEFGVGFSTVVIAHALMMNEIEFKKIPLIPKIRNTNQFKHFVVDSNQFWLNNTEVNFPDDLKQFVKFSFSEVKIEMLSDFQICSFYERLPDIVPEYIYLDGPDPADVKGDINGITFKCKERTIIAGDILKYETSLLPGAYLLVDGRSNNVRFLRNNLKRGFTFNWDQINDRSVFELTEDKLGPHNYKASELYYL